MTNSPRKKKTLIWAYKNNAFENLAKSPLQLYVCDCSPVKRIKHGRFFQKTKIIKKHKNRGGEFRFPQGTYDKSEKQLKINLFFLSNFKLNFEQGIPYVFWSFFIFTSIRQSSWEQIPAWEQYFCMTIFKSGTWSELKMLRVSSIEKKHI